MQVPFVDLKAQYQTIKPEVDNAIGNVISNTAFVLGKAVADFERNLPAIVRRNTPSELIPAPLL